jgi:hypothetical protein
MVARRADVHRVQSTAPRTSVKDVGALAVWGARHVRDETALVHSDCGKPVQVGYYCPRCGERVCGSAVQM